MKELSAKFKENNLKHQANKIQTSAALRKKSHMKDLGSEEFNETQFEQNQGICHERKNNLGLP